jgi:hypothetical protein
VEFETLRLLDRLWSEIEIAEVDEIVVRLGSSLHG